MAVQSTTPSSSSHGTTLARLRDALRRLTEAIASLSAAAACGREAERLMQLSDEELAARGLTRDRIVEHAFRRYMTMV